MPAAAAARRRILLVMVDAEARQQLGRGLREHGYGVHGAADVASAAEILDATPIDLVLAEVEAASPSLAELAPILSAGPTVFVVGRGVAEPAAWARSAIAAGAYDCLLAPAGSAVRTADVLFALEKAAAREAARRDPAASRFLPEPAQAAEAALPAAELPTLIAESVRMKTLLAQLRKLAAHRTPVLLTGESGTGKEMLAKTLHLLSPRRQGPWVAINCGALPENLLESLLFGHRRGAFTDAVRDQRGVFEEANRGTLLLDEIGELSLKLQVKLLRVLQDQKIQPLGAGNDEVTTVDVRVVAATLRDLEADVQAGRFRADLYYRLSVVPLHVPALRDRREDILPLARHFLHRAATRLGRPIHGMTPAAEQGLLRNPWPGNVRELENTIERAAVLCEHTVLDISDLPLRPGSRAEAAGALDAEDLSIRAAARRLEGELIERALTRTRGNRSAAARLLGLSHRALLYKLREHGLEASGAHDDGQNARRLTKRPKEQ